MNKLIFGILAFFSLQIQAQQMVAPLEEKQYQSPTTYAELSKFVSQLDAQSNLLHVQVFGQSVEGRNLYALQFSNEKFGQNKSKLKIIIFAQQHGNEQSGKEGALLLAKELLDPKHKALFERIDLVIVPQVNPDGSEKNSRRNAHNTDLNRNHLLLSEPETLALHQLFDNFQFEINIDVHEYAPYGATWEKYGARKNSDITIGTNTNINISSKIRKLSNQEIIPFALKRIAEKGFSKPTLLSGRPPETEAIRHSTFDINDGRQSFGIRNIFSFIQEGLNGTDMFSQNLEHRAKGQAEGLMSMLQYFYNQAKILKKIVRTEQNKLAQNKVSDKISIRSEHVRNGQKLMLPLLSYSSLRDTIVAVENYLPEVKTKLNVTRPQGYLVPRELTQVREWIKRQAIDTMALKSVSSLKTTQYRIIGSEKIDFEGDTIASPLVALEVYNKPIDLANYVYLPMNQQKSNIIALALEPQSMLGLATYKEFETLVKEGEFYPILRVLKE